MRLINAIMRAYLLRRWRKSKAEIAHSPDTQTQLLQRLLQKAEQTEQGRTYNFSTIKSEAEFKKRVPLGDYESHLPSIERMMQGERNVLWPGEMRLFAKSSGTTAAKSKFLPVSQEAIQQGHISGAHEAMAFWYAQNPESRFFESAKSLIMGGAHSEVKGNSRAIVGDISALMLANLPFYARYFLAPSLDIAVLADWEEKIERMAQQILGENITSISGVPTWTLVLFQRLLELTGKKTIIEVFPRLEMYQHGGVSFGPYREQFRRIIGSEQVAFRETYNASEGFFATQFAEGDAAMLLLCNNGSYYEFIPFAEYGKEDARSLSLQEVEIGQIYVLLISSNSGLWRYALGDTIEFTSTAPPKIRVVGRTKQYLNTFGEELMVVNTDEALLRTCLAHRAQIRDYSVAPQYLDDKGQGRHQWLIEFEQAPQDAVAFLRDLDKTLQELNSDYEAKRFKNIALQLPSLEILPSGHFKKWLKSKGKLGGQNKVPRLSNQRTYVDELLALMYEK